MAHKRQHSRGVTKPAQLENKWQEIGSLGLQSFMGFVSQAYSADLTWPTCFPLFNRIRRSDPEVAIVRNGYTALARKVEVSVNLPEDATPDEQALGDFYESELDNLEGGVTRWLETLVSYTPFMGWAWWEVVPGLRVKDWRPPDDDPWRSQADDGLIGVRRLAWRDHSTFARWELDDATGRLRGMYQRDFPNPEILLPLDRSLHVTFGDASNPEGLTPLEAVYRLERIKYGLEVVQGIGFEHAAGYLDVIVNGKPSAADLALIAAAARAILTAQEGNYATWTEKIKGEIKDTDFSAATAILEAIRYYGLLKLQLYNMQWVAIASTAGTGAYSAMSDASSMFLAYWNAMLASFVDQYDEQVGRRLYQWNRGRYPNARRPHYKARPTSKVIDLQELGAFWQAISATMPVGKQDYIEVRKRSGFLPEELPEVVAEPTPVPEGEEPDSAGDGMDEDPGTMDDDGAGDETMRENMENRRAMFALAHALEKATEAANV